MWETEAFLDKPFTVSGLLETVSQLLTRRIGGDAAPRGRKM